jgi:hypothetical protein
MSITNLIKKIVTPKLSKLGFNYLGIEGGVRWIFERRTECVSQRIMYLKSIYHKGINVELKVEFDQEAEGLARTEYANYLIDKRDKVWWKYSDDNELEKALDELIKIVENKGIEFLSLASIPSIKPSRTLSKNIYNNRIELINSFKINHESEFFEKDELSTISQIDNLICAYRDRSFEECTLFFLETAAYCGQIVENKSKGSWFYDEEQGRCLILCDGFTIDPLFWVINYWNVELKDNSISYLYELLCQP